MSYLNITKLDASSADFGQQLQQLLAWDEADDLDIQQRVLAIIADVRKNGDKAVIDYTNRFDHRNIIQAGELELSKELLKSAWEKLPVDQAQALQSAADRVRAYAEHQKCSPGNTQRQTVPCLVKKLLRWTGSVSMCRVGKRLIHHLY